MSAVLLLAAWTCLDPLLRAGATNHAMVLLTKEAFRNGNAFFPGHWRTADTATLREFLDTAKRWPTSAPALENVAKALWWAGHERAATNEWERLVHAGQASSITIL